MQAHHYLSQAVTIITAHINTISLVFIFAFLLSACGGSSSSSSDSTGASSSNTKVTFAEALSKPLGQDVACQLQITPTQVAPGDVVTILGVPAAFNEPGFRVLAETDEGEAVIAPLFASIPNESSPSDEVRFTAPLHPVNLVSGGKVMIELGDGTHRCPAFELTITALPEPVTQQEKDASDPQQVLAKLQAWVDRSIKRMGYDPVAILNTDQVDVPPQ